MRTARIKGDGGDFYHCMSRVVDRQFILGEVEKEVFRRMLRKCERFCAVRVITYTVMSNHFHILVEVPPRGEISDAEWLRRLGALYARGRVRELGRQLRQLRAQDTPGALLEAEGLKARYTYRMGDVSEFLKTLKQRFTQWYNGRKGRRGTLWEERFKSVLVEGRGHALATMAAYIDLNAVRAGLVNDPRQYRYCGYGEAVAGSARARQGLGRVMEGLGQPTEWTAVRSQYREQLYVAGEESPQRKGFPAREVRRVLEAGGELSAAQALRCRVRYFSDGVALGSREYVESVFRAHRDCFGAKRRSGARPMRLADWGGLCTARALRLAPVSVPG